MEEATLDFDEQGRLFNWIEANIFRSDTHNKKTYARLAGLASVELKMEVSEDLLASGLAAVCREKNWNLAKYLFDTGKPSW